MYKKIVISITLILLILYLAGCGTLKRKFTRKPKEKPAPEPILELKDYTQSLPVDELYKKHFLYWKYWEDELINSLGKNYKKQRLSVREALANLKLLESYLVKEEKVKLKPYLEQLEDIADQLNIPGRISDLTIRRIRIKLEQHKRYVDKTFSFNKVKGKLISDY